MLVEDLFERDLAVQLGVEGDEDGAQAALGVGSEDVKPPAVAGGRADGERGRAVAVAVVVLPGRLGSGADAGENGIEVRLADHREALAGRAAGGDDGQAPLGIAVVAAEVGGGQAVQQVAMGGLEVSQGDEVLGERPGLIPGPGVEGGHQRRLVDQAGL